MPVPGKNSAEPYFNPLGLNSSMITLTGMATPVGAPPGTTDYPPYRIGQSGQSKQMLLVAGEVVSKIIPGSGGLAIRDNTDSFNNLLIDNSGNVTGQSQSIVSPVLTAYQQSSLFTKTAIPDTTATAMAQVSIPNGNASFGGTITLRTAVTAAGQVYASTRVAIYTFVIARVAGSVAVATLSSATIPIIATSGTNTLTTTLAISAVTGGATAVNTFNFTVANVGTPSGISESTLYIEQVVGEAAGAVFPTWSAQ